MHARFIKKDSKGVFADAAGNIIPSQRNHVDAIANKFKGMPRVPPARCGGAEFPKFVWLDS
jgi:hypothetical protein